HLALHDSVARLQEVVLVPALFARGDLVDVAADLEREVDLGLRLDGAAEARRRASRVRRCELDTNRDRLFLRGVRGGAAAETGQRERRGGEKPSEAISMVHGEPGGR